MADKKFEIVGGAAIITTGKKTIVQEEFEKVADSVTTPNVGSGDSAQEVFDRFSKLLYLVDVSGSMGGGIPSEESVKMYYWDPETLLTFRSKMKTEFDDTMPPDNPDDFDDEALKILIVEQGLDDKYNIKLPANWHYSGTSRTKIQAVKDAAKDFVHKRFEKFPDARVGVFEFNDNPRLLAVDGASESEVIAAINRFRTKGGTDIMKAVTRAVSDCQKRPSKVNANHIVLVSDGCDYGAVNVTELLPKMKELPVVFDFIYIAGTSDTAPEAVVTAMKKVCEETGGEFVIVKTEKDFVQKFLTASTRPLLMAPK